MENGEHRKNVGEDNMGSITDKIQESYLPIMGKKQTKSPTHIKAPGTCPPDEIVYPPQNADGTYGAGIPECSLEDMKILHRELDAINRAITGPAPSTQEPDKIDMKFDVGKMDWTLLMEGVPHALEEVSAVLGYGCQKYEAHSWQEVTDAINRYKKAAWRHYMKLAKGETHDDESGLRHEAHIVTNLLFVMELTKHLGTIEFNEPPERNENG